MNNAIRLAHCLGAILTGITILVLAVAISATNGSTWGVFLGFQALVSGYAVGVYVTANSEPVGNLTAYLGVFSWASSALAIIAAIVSMI